MITLSKAAAEQVRKAAETSNATGMALRIAARVDDDGAIEYTMGFDDTVDEDVRVSSEGVDIVVASGYKELLVGTTIDYVELNPNEFRFIFSNPNDPNHRPPTERAN